MLSHSSIWTAIDALAAEHGLSVSGLARRAGLDPTTFNRSKRISRDGKPRWPSTESIAKILHATGSTLPELVAHIDGGGAAGAEPLPLPLASLEGACASDAFDATGRPCGTAWRELPAPGLTTPGAFALEIEDDSFRPLLRRGDVVVLSAAAEARPGDRVVLRTTAGEIMLGDLVAVSSHAVEVEPLGLADASNAVPAGQVAWLARILWIRQ